MDEIRCGTCRKLLARVRAAELQIKCPRCGALNRYQKAASLPLERPGAPNDQEAQDADQPEAPAGA